VDTFKKVILRGTTGSLGVCIAYAIARAVGAYLSLCAIAIIPRYELGLLAVCYSGLWWVSIVTAGTVRTALIARSIGDPVRAALYDDQARLLWHLCAAGAIITALIVGQIGYCRAPLLGALLWCYVGALWSDWFFAASARAHDTSHQSRLFYGGALLQLLVAHFCVPAFGLIGALYAQGAFYWGAVVAHGHYQAFLPRRCSLYDLLMSWYASFSYMPGLLYSWMTASATRMILLMVYGAGAVGVWAAIELLISPVITATSTLLTLLYLPRLLRGDFGTCYPAEHPLCIIFLGGACALLAHSAGASLEISCAIMYTAVLIASMAMALWAYRAAAAFYERAIPFVFAVCQTVVAAVVWSHGTALGVLVGQTVVLLIGMIVYGFCIGARVCDSSIYSVLRRRALRICD